MPHFTYAPKDPAVLMQGDVLRRTDGINDILKAVHHHYFENDNYKYFIVLTQSCDLVRRHNGEAGSRYISIAAVRPATVAIQREAEKLLYSDIDRRLGICDDSRRAKLEQFVERLLNNNESEYFFLYREPHFGITEDHCAFLRLSIAIKSELHYNTLLEAKILQLKESFQHKLGYLLGTCYARIGTEDWLPDNIDENLWKKKVADSVTEVKTINFIPKEDYNYVVKKAKGVAPDSLSVEILDEFLQEKKREKARRREGLADTLAEILTEIGVEAEKINAAKKAIAQDPRLSAFIK